ncbi:ALG-2 interacting isoform B [Micractinium conductrix]|uniref:ALG-2 interacting isoform B n=1 Tax=Micractinium conductrix TaxID=554055 RepID=A0A2P6VEN2_9CHLO|nr:ALG-2 interacting isoform B [Micractinium conductrix]|eukprot:PSC72553.1 ALG-2 interacting isoform B [Micractinium conductrix]
MIRKINQAFDRLLHSLPGTPFARKRVIAAADATYEREALLAISEQLEYLEDKLREYRFLEPSELDNKAVLLSQLDAVRRELVEVVGAVAQHITFGKEVVRDVLAFAQVGDSDAPADADGELLPPGEALEQGMAVPGPEEGGTLLSRLRASGTASLGGFASEIEAEGDAAAAPGSGGALRRSTQRTAGMYGTDDGEAAAGEPAGGSGFIPAVRRSGALPSRPPRYPSQAGGGTAKESLLVPGPKQQRCGSGADPAGAPTSPSWLHQRVPPQASPTQRSAFLQHQQPEVPAAPGAAQRAHPLAANAVPGSTGGRRQLNVDGPLPLGASRGAAGAEAYSFSQPQPQAQGQRALGGQAAQQQQQQQQQAAAAQQQQQQSVQGYPVAPSSYAPSTYAPSEGIPSSRQSPYSARTLGAAAPPAAPPPAAAPPGQRLGGSKLLTRLNRHAGGAVGDSASGSRYGVYSRVSDDDIYGALEGSSGRPASIMNPSPRQYGGYVRIRDRMGTVEEGSMVPGPKSARRSPTPPRIYGAEEPEGDLWETRSEIEPAGYAAAVTLNRSPAALREHPDSGPRPPRITHSAPAHNPLTPPRDRLHLAYSSGGAGVAPAPAGRAQHSTARVGRHAGTSSSRSGASDGGGGGGGLLGRLTNMLLTGAAAAAVAVVAQHAGPVVVAKGQEAVRTLQEKQAAVASRWQASQRKREDAQRKREAERRAGRLADAPPSPATYRAMADAPPAALSAQLAAQAAPAFAPPPRQQPKPSPGRLADLAMPPPRSPGARCAAADLPPAPRAGSTASRMGDLPIWERQQAAPAAAAAAAAAAAQRQASAASANKPGKPAAKAPMSDPLPAHLTGRPAPSSAAGSTGGRPAQAPGAMQQVPAGVAAEPAPASQQHLAFLQSWRSQIAPRLTQLLTLLAGQEVARNLAVAQVWTYLPVLTEGRQVLKAEQLCLLGDAQLQGFHEGCAAEGVTVNQLGPMGKVWENGAVQVVQCAQSLSSEMHPCNRLPGPLSACIEECIYLPVYDRTGQVSQGVLAVIELLVRAGSHDPMVVANAISCLTHIMEALHLSVGNPHAMPAPMAPPKGSLAASAAARGGNGGAVGGGCGAQPAKRACPPGAAGQPLPHSSNTLRNNAVAFGSGGSGKGSGGSLGRSMSMARLA